MAGRRSARREWFAVFGSAAAWFVHLVGLYVLVPWTCARGGRPLMLGASALLAGVTLVAGLTSWSLWHAIEQQERERVLQTMEGQRTSFLALAGLLASAVFLLGIILATIPVLFVDPCAPTRGI